MMDGRKAIRCSASGAVISNTLRQTQSSPLRDNFVSNVTKRRFVRRIERWLVGLVMAAMAYMIEKMLLRSIRREQTKTNPSE